MSSTRIWWHRFGSLAIPGSSSTQRYEDGTTVTPHSSAAAAFAAAAKDGLTWRHVFIQPDENVCVVGLPFPPEGGLRDCVGPSTSSSSSDATCTTTGAGLRRFLQAAVSQLSTSLARSGRTLDILKPTPASSASSSGAFDSVALAKSIEQCLLQFATKVQATEIHSVVSRGDPWSSDADAALRAAASQVGVSKSSRIVV